MNPLVTLEPLKPEMLDMITAELIRPADSSQFSPAPLVCVALVILAAIVPRARDWFALVLVLVITGTASAERRPEKSAAAPRVRVGTRTHSAVHAERQRRIDRAWQRYEWQLQRWEAEQRAISEWNQRVIAEAPIRAAAAQAIAADSLRRAAEAQERAEYWHHEPYHWRYSYYDPWWGY